MLIRLTDPSATDPGVVGAKAARLAAAAAAGFTVPGGVVVAVDGDHGDHERVDEGPHDTELTAAARQLGTRVAVRSSAVAEDLADASFAGLYESFLDVPPDRVPQAVRACRAAADAHRVTAYRSGRPDARIAVLVQAMVPARAAGVAFTADPVTGDRDQVVLTAVAGLAEPLVAGVVAGEEWRVRARTATPTGDGRVVTAKQAVAVAELARRLEVLFGSPQDVEWAWDGSQVRLLQTRPMTALPDPVDWVPPGPGLWACNFRLGEWLPEPVTTLFGDWLLPQFDRGFQAGMRETAGAEVTFPYALVNDWYYATPNPALGSIPGAVLRSRGRVLRFMLATLVLPGRDPVRADQTLNRLYRQWRDELLPEYRRLADTDPDGLDVDGLTGCVERVMQTAGRHFWYLAVVGGAAWKMEQALRRFLARHGLPPEDAAALLTALNPPATPPAHAVHSLDWYHPTAAEPALPATPAAITEGPESRDLHRQRADAERRCRTHLRGYPKELASWTAMTATARRYARIRQQQTDTLTLGWPLLRRCAERLAAAFTEAGIIDDPQLLFFLNETELRHRQPASAAAMARQQRWQQHRTLVPPLTIGRPPRLLRGLVGTVAAPSTAPGTGQQLLGQAASPGRATGPVRIVATPDDLVRIQPGDVLVAPTTTPAWTPALRHAAAVVTDRGTAAAHAAIIAREYGIPAVVATGDATRKLHDGTIVTVDGSRGTVTLPKAAAPPR